MLIRDLKLVGFAIKDFIPDFQINWTIVIKSTFLYSIFIISFGRLVYYWLSFIFPNYIENLINSNRPTNFNVLVAEIFFSILILPIFDLIICLVLQKQALKWNNKISILFLSIVSSLMSFSPSFFGSFLHVIIWAILFYKTASLLNIFIFQTFINLIFNFIYIITYRNNNNLFNISIIEYQEIHQPYLILYSILAMISITFIINFIYKNFPKENDLIPLYKNRSKLLS